MIDELSVKNISLNSDWKYVALEDVVEKASSNISLNKLKDDEGNYPLYSAKGFSKNISFYQQEKEYLAIIKDGAGIGRVTRHPPKSSVVGTMQYLIPKDGFDIGFVQYFLNGVDFESHRQGSTIPHIYFKDYKSELVPLLPLEKQKQIVSMLDKSFAAIDTAKGNVEQNLLNAKELFDSYLHNIFENKDDDWEYKTLDEICYKITDGSHNPPKGKDSGRKMASGRNITEDGLDLRKVRYITEKEFEKENKRTDVKSGDVLLTIVGTIGRSLVFPEGIEKLTFQRSVAVLKPKQGLDSNFLSRLFVSKKYQDIFKSKARGAAQKGIYLKTLRAISIPYPSLTVQKQIVEKLNLISTEIKKIETIYTQKIADLEEMKKSILQKAFSGQLKNVS